MKRITLIVVSVIFILFSVLPVNAVSDVSFTATDVECNVDRLFTVDIKAQSEDLFSVATFEFNYDRSLIEFREVSSDSNSFVRAYDNGKSVVVSYLCKDGIKASDYTTIFTLKFKSLSTGNTNLGYSVSNCVNSFVENMPIGSCTSASVTINSKSANEQKENYNKENKTDNNSKISSVNPNNDTYQNSISTIDQLGLLNENSFDDTTKMFVIGGLCGAAFVVVLVAVFFIGRNSAKAQEKDKESEPIDIDELLS